MLFFCYKLYPLAGTGLALEMNQSHYYITIIIDNIAAYRNQGVEGANVYINALNSFSYVLLANMNSSYAISLASSVWYSLMTLVLDSSSWLFSCRDSSLHCNYATYMSGSSLYLNIIANHYPIDTQIISEIINLISMLDYGLPLNIIADSNVCIFIIDYNFSIVILLCFLILIILTNITI